MKLIELTRGLFTQVDDEDYEFLMQWNWQCNYTKRKNCPPNCYAVRQVRKTENGIKSRKQIKMHRVLMNISDPKIYVDHIDGNGLNNQRNNLRLASPLENARNRSGRGKSKYKGVCYCAGVSRKKGKNGNVWTSISPRWVVNLKINGKVIVIGRFPLTPEGEIEAAKAYNKATSFYHGEFAKLNKFEENE